MMGSLRWKIQRVRAMSPGEIAWRAGNVLRNRFEAAGFGLAARVPAASGKAGRSPVCLTPAGVDSPACLVRADRVLLGRFDVFALRDVELGFPPDWNRDPRTGTRAPLEFGKTLDYRRESVVGDIKYLWEFNRHLELVALAQAWALTRDERYALGCRALLESWFEACPYPLGVHWTSSLEHAVRLVNWAIAWDLLGGDAAALFTGIDGRRFRERWLECIYRHCHFIAGHFSLHSSANNHLFGEYMGLFVAASTWPFWPRSAAWRARARDGLEAEALRQNGGDGVNREQALWYHHEVADMMLLAGLTARANGEDFSRQFWMRLEAMLEFIHAVMDSGGEVPMVGDADDGVMVRLAAGEGFDPYRSLLATGAALYGRADFKAKARAFDDKSRWLLGAEGERAFAAATRKADVPRRAFGEGGYWILGSAFDTCDEIRALFDAGPLGYLAIAAHGHADALALTVSAAGESLLIDPGTFAYHTQQAWRDHFRGTLAHNTVCIDGLDQSVIGGNFLWTRHAHSRMTAFESTDGKDRVAGEHDGYTRLPDPVVHAREVVFDKVARRFVVRDILRCAGEHVIEITWHCDERATVSIEGGFASVRRARAGLLISCDGGLDLRLAKGETAPPLGWVSRRFDERTPAPVLVWKGRIRGATVIETRIDVVRID